MGAAGHPPPSGGPRVADPEAGRGLVLLQPDHGRHRLGAHDRPDLREALQARGAEEGEHLRDHDDAGPKFLKNLAIFWQTSSIFLNQMRN